MARPQKEGLDYFPHDVDMDQDDKVIMVTAKYGMEGYGILNKLMQQIYKERGYYMDWSERDRHVFKNRVNVDIDTLDGVINECLQWGFFNKNKYDQYQIFTSSGFQKRYIEAAKRRKVVSIINEYILVDINEMIEQYKTPLKIVNANSNLVNVNINSVIDNSGITESTQSKVNKSTKKHIVDSSECDLQFEEFWKAYPKKDGKEPAKKKWNSYYKKKEIHFETVMSGLNRYIAFINHERSVRKFNREWLSGSTFVNQKQWDSEWKIESNVKPFIPASNAMNKPTAEELREIEELGKRAAEHNRASNQ